MTSTPSAPKQQMRNAVPALLSALLAIALYAITLGGGYIYDDMFVVHDDERVHSPHQWYRLWTTDYFDGGIDNLYRPIVSTSYGIEWWLHGDRPWIFHAFNVLLHAAAAATVAEFTRRAMNLFSSDGRSRSTALIAGLLFAAHPLHVEAVANIVGRAELACTACIFAALILLCRSPLTIRRVIAVLTVAMMGVLCKEQGILQPVLWIFLGISLRFSTRSRSEVLQKPGSPDPAKPRQLLLLLTCWIWAAYLIAREHFLKFEWDRTGLDPNIQPLIRSAGLDRMLMPVVLLGRYTALLFWPAHLSVDYGAGVIGSVARKSDPNLWLGFSTAIVWTLTTAWCLLTLGKKTVGRFMLFCLLCFAVTYSIAGNILTFIGTIFAERLMYLPSAFLVMAVAVLLCKFPPRWCYGVTGILVLAASVKTVAEAEKWNHPLALYESSLKSQPKSIQVQFLLAQEHQRLGDHPAAALDYQRVCEMYPDYWRAWEKRCEEAMQAGDFKTADDSLARAIKLMHNQVLPELADRLAKAEAAAKKQ